MASSAAVGSGRFSLRSKLQAERSPSGRLSCRGKDHGRGLLPMVTPSLWRRCWNPKVRSHSLCCCKEFGAPSPLWKALPVPEGPLGSLGGRYMEEPFLCLSPRPEVSRWQCRGCPGFEGLETNSLWEMGPFEKEKRDTKLDCMGQNIFP